MIAIDTNLLVYAHRSGLPEHRRSQRAIEKASRNPRGWGIALPCLSEFWSVVTHPTAAGRPSTAREATRFLDALIEGAGAQIWLPGAGTWRRLEQLAGQLDVRGPRIFDLQIAVIASDQGATELWTHDASFLSVAGLRIVDPLA